MEEENDIFTDIRNMAIIEWKRRYIQELSELKNISEDDLDDWKASKVIDALKHGFCTNKSFAKEIKRIYGKWDSITLSMKYGAIERLVQQHYCEFWDKCIDKCGGRDTWKDYAPFSLVSE